MAYILCLKYMIETTKWNLLVSKEHMEASGCSRVNMGAMLYVTVQSLYPGWWKVWSPGKYLSHMMTFDHILWAETAMVGQGDLLLLLFVCSVRVHWTLNLNAFDSWEEVVAKKSNTHKKTPNNVCSLLPNNSSVEELSFDIESAKCALS